MKTWIRPLLLAVTVGLALSVAQAAHADPKHGRGHHGHDRYWVPPGHRVDTVPRVVFLQPERPRYVLIERDYRPPIYAVPVNEPSINVIFPINLR